MSTKKPQRKGICDWISESRTKSSIDVFIIKIE